MYTDLQFYLPGEWTFYYYKIFPLRRKILKSIFFDIHSKHFWLVFACCFFFLNYSVSLYLTCISFIWNICAYFLCNYWYAAFKYVASLLSSFTCLTFLFSFESFWIDSILPIFFLLFIFLKYYWDFPSGPLVENLPDNAGHMGSILDLGRFHMLQGNSALRSPWTATRKPICSKEDPAQPKIK